jgi:hypothetical protein
MEAVGEALQPLGQAPAAAIPYTVVGDIADLLAEGGVDRHNQCESRSVRPLDGVSNARAKGEETAMGPVQTEAGKGVPVADGSELRIGDVAPEPGPELVATDGSPPVGRDVAG